MSGTAVALAAAGALLLYDGIRGVSIPAALRSLVTAGTLPAPALPAAAPGGSTAAAGAGAVGTGANAAIAQYAMTFEGKVPYKWGGADPSGWDCSGFATYVLVHTGHTNLPSNYHTVCMQFYTWSGAVKVATPEAGDLVVWPTHMGIAINSTQMISALNPSRGTTVTTFSDGAPSPGSTPTFMRVL